MNKFVCHFESEDTSTSSSYKPAEEHAPKSSIADGGVPSAYQSTVDQAANPNGTCPLRSCRFVVATALVALLIALYVAYSQLYATEPSN